MSKNTSKADRIELRNWLRRTIRFGVLDRVPPKYTPDGRGDGPGTHEHARKLQAELSDPDGARRSLEAILADIRAFRDWVEARQLKGRRTIMAEVPEKTFTRPTEVYRAPRFGVTEQSSHPSTTWTTPNPTQDPMWDKWLDW